MPETTVADSAERLTTTLPFLRRYARALAGSQSHGDQWVRLCVEVLLHQPNLMGDGARSKADIFALFHRLQQPFRRLENKKDVSGPSTVRERLEAQMDSMPDLHRSALLLTALEGFSVQETARILGTPEGETEETLREAREALRRTASARILVIEDEALIALNIAQIVRNAGHQVAGIAATEKAAVALAASSAPDLVLADIQLRGRDNGIAAAQQILKSLPVPVIFVTAYPERLLTGQGVEPVFVITKPFDPHTLKTAIAQALDVASI